MRNFWRGNFFQVPLFFLIIFCTFYNWIFVAASILFVPWQQEKSSWHLFFLLLACCNYNKEETMFLPTAACSSWGSAPRASVPKYSALKTPAYLFKNCTGQVMFRCCFTKVQLFDLVQAALHGALDKGLNGQHRLGLIDSIISWCRRWTGEASQWTAGESGQLLRDTLALRGTTVDPLDALRFGISNVMLKQHITHIAIRKGL